MDDLKTLIFELNDDSYGVDSLQIRELVKYQDVEVSSDSALFDCLYNLRGTTIPVIDLSKRLNMGKTKITKKTKIMMVLTSEILVGFIVNDVTNIITINGSKLEPIPNIVRENSKNYMKSIIRMEDKLLYIMDLEKLLTHEEIVELSNFR